MSADPQGAPQGDPARERSERRARRWLAIAGAAALLAIGLALSIGNGAIPIDGSTSLHALHLGLLGRSSELGGSAAIVWTLRVPRALMAAIVGASLGASGASMQGLFRNPLADPHLLGVSSGASLGATLALTRGDQIAQAFGDMPFLGSMQVGVVPIAAFLGALVAVSLTLLVSRRSGSTAQGSLLLGGVVVGSVLLAVSSALMLQDSDRLRAVIAWTLGSFAWSSWSSVGALLPYAALSLAAMYALARGLDALQLGEETAGTLMPRIGAVRLGVIAAASLATAAAVAFAGVIGFVGLVAPHMMRRLGTPDHRTLVPASAIAGAALLIFADLGARTLVRPAELPIGIVTTLLGGPFFLWLLRRSR